jgi:hypothetical protein
VLGSINNRAAVLGLSDSADDTEAVAKQERLRGQLGAIRQRYPDGTAISLLSYRDALPTLALPHEATAYFGGNRGSNGLNAVDVLAVVGTPQPPIGDVVRQASMIYEERMEPFDTTWSSKATTYADGTPAEYSGYHADDALHRVLEQQRQAEIIQSLHRARPLRRPVDVWLLTSLPLGIATTLIQPAELFGAVSRLGTPLRGFRADVWPTALSTAHAALAQRQTVTAPRFAELLDVSTPTARKLLQALGETADFALVKSRVDGSDRPVLTLVYREAVL